MSLETNGGSPLSIVMLLRDLPKLIWALVLLIGGVAYVAIEARRRRCGGRTARTTSVAAQKER